MKKKILIAAIAAALGVKANAQLLPNGTTLNNTFALTDLNGSTVDVFTTLDAGKHLLLDISATWCSSCWGLHQSKLIDNYYTQYAAPQTADALVYFVEGDANTSLADIQGTGGNTVGNWTSGTTHPIMHASASELSTMNSAITVNGAGGYGFPTVLLFCADRKMYKVIPSQQNTVAKLRTFAESTCGLTPLSINQNNTPEKVALSWYIASTKQLKVVTNASNDFTVTLYSLSGSQISKVSGYFNAGENVVDLSDEMAKIVEHLTIAKITIGNDTQFFKLSN
jgi:hypothetical protein